MREELQRVLGYPQIARRCWRSQLVRAGAGPVRPLEPGRNAGVHGAVRCRDPDDQKFIDLAVAHGALLLSKDALVLRLRKRLLGVGVVMCASTSNFQLLQLETLRPRLRPGLAVDQRQAARSAAAAHRRASASGSTAPATCTFGRWSGARCGAP
jgi:hypothetical protein